MNIQISDHASQRLTERGITQQQVTTTIKMGQSYPANGGATKYILNNITVLAKTHSGNIIVITAYKQ